MVKLSSINLLSFVDFAESENVNIYTKAVRFNEIAFS